MVTPSAKVAPITRSVTVGRSPAEAFRIFTQEIGSWWPAIGHSIGGERVTDVVFEPQQSGRVYEVWDDGTQHDWATLLAWEEGSRLVMAWKPNPERPAPTEIEIRFVPDGAGTRVELEHREWDRLGPDAEDLRASYADGWGATLGSFVKAAS